MSPIFVCIQHRSLTPTPKENAINSSKMQKTCLHPNEKINTKPTGNIVNEIAKYKSSAHLYYV
jgi:hypothetical protein